MQKLLSYGDGESAVKIAFQNEHILFLLEHVKDGSVKSDTTHLRSVADSCIQLQEECDTLLQSITLEYKKELNTHLVRRQLLVHLKKT